MKRNGRRMRSRAAWLALALGFACASDAAAAPSRAAAVLYWATGGPTPNSVQRAALDGSAPPVIEDVVTGLEAPAAVTIDEPRGHLYFGTHDGGTHALWRTDLDGAGLLGIVARASPAPQVPVGIQGIAIDAAAGRVYWTTIQGGAPLDHDHVFAGALPVAAEATILHADHFGTNPRGLVLDSDGDQEAGDDTLYWLSDAGLMRRSTLAGPNHGEFVATVHEPRELAFDPAARILYWTELVQSGTQAVPGLGRIRSLRTDLAGGIVDVATGLDLPIALARDASTGLLYYGNQDGDIFEVDPDTGTQTLVLATGLPVRSLAVLEATAAPPPGPRGSSSGGACAAGPPGAMGAASHLLVFALAALVGLRRRR